MTDHNHKSLDQSRKDLKEAIAKRDRLNQKVEQLRGRLSAAQEEAAKIAQECVERGVSADKLDATIEQLQKRLEREVSDYVKQVNEFEAEVAPFMQEDS